MERSEIRGNRTRLRDRPRIALRSIRATQIIACRLLVASRCYPQAQGARH